MVENLSATRIFNGLDREKYLFCEMKFFVGSCLKACFTDEIIIDSV